MLSSFTRHPFVTAPRTSVNPYCDFAPRHNRLMACWRIAGKLMSQAVARYVLLVYNYRYIAESTNRKGQKKKVRGLGRIYKRGSVWWIAYYHRGKEHRESTESDRESQAKKLLKKRLGEIGRGILIGPVEGKVRFDDLAQGLITDYKVNGKRSVSSAELSIRHLRDFFGFDRALDITTDRVMTYIGVRQQEIAKRNIERKDRKRLQADALKAKARSLPEDDEKFRSLAEAGWLEEQTKALEAISNASINRELAALKRMISLAIQAGKLTSRPYIPTLEENNARQGFLDHGNFCCVRGKLAADLQDPVSFLYLTGWRVSEMRALEWRDVDLPGKLIRLRPEISKNKQGRPLPLDGELLEIIQRAFRNRRLDSNYVFHRDGRKIGDFKKAWRTACLLSGLGGLLVHDFRRTTVRNLTRSQVTEKIAMTMTGHKTRSVFDRYDIVDERDLAQAAGQLDLYLKAKSNEPSITMIKKVV